VSLNVFSSPPPDSNDAPVLRQEKENFSLAMDGEKVYEFFRADLVRKTFTE